MVTKRDSVVMSSIIVLSMIYEATLAMNTNQASNVIRYNRTELILIGAEKALSHCESLPIKGSLSKHLTDINYLLTHHSERKYAINVQLDKLIKDMRDAHTMQKSKFPNS